MGGRRFAEIPTYRSEAKDHHVYIRRSADWVQRFVHWSSTSKSILLDGHCDLPWAQAKIEVKYVTHARATVSRIDLVTQRHLKEAF